MTFVVVYDACVLYPSLLRDVLIRVAQEGLVQAKWTDAILDEVFRNLRADRPDLDPAKLSRTRQLMAASVRDCLVKGYEPLVGAIALPDPDDRHVVAAAIRARAHLIVTSNLTDFPASSLRQFDIEAISPDDFLTAQMDLDRGVLWRILQQISDTYRNPPVSVGDLVGRLRAHGLIRTAAALERA